MKYPQICELEHHHRVKPCLVTVNFVIPHCSTVLRACDWATFNMTEQNLIWLSKFNMTELTQACLDIWPNNQFELKNTCCCSNSNYLLSSFKKHVLLLQPKLLAIFIYTSGRDNMSKQYEHTQFHSAMGTRTHCAFIIFLSLNPPPHLEAIWLVMHVVLPSHIVFLRSRLII